jgi:HEAT repeat protein
MNRHIVTVCAACAVLAAAYGTGVASGSTIEQMLEDKELAAAYNPVLLNFLLQEGKSSLPAEQHTAAVDQLVTALKQDIDITPEEQRAAALAAAGAGLAQLFGNDDVSDVGSVAQSATYQLWKGWIDSAVILRKAGYNAEANAFFATCIEIFPYGDLRGRCAIELAVADPADAFAKLMALTEGNDADTINPVLRILGRLVAQDGFPQELRAQGISRLTEFTGGLKKASHGVAACQGLAATNDPSVVPTLQKLSTGMMNQDFFACSRRALLLQFDDRSVVKPLEKSLKGGMFSTAEPGDRLFAAELLMEAGEASGFAYAENELTKKQKKGLGKLMKSSDEVDLRPALVSALVRVGGDESRRVLHQAMGAVEKGSWLETWIAVALLELDDTSHIALAKAALANPEWSFTQIRIATALAHHDDYSGVPALEKLYSQAAQGIEPDYGKATLAVLAGRGGEYSSSTEAKKRRLLRIREQIAAALATIDRPECIQLLKIMLQDHEAPVRVSAAYGLARCSSDGTLAAMTQGLDTDYGSVAERSRNPVVHAHLARVGANHHPDDARTALLAKAAESPFASVRFLALCAVAEEGTRESPDE